ncbi:DUF4391 domain-containing protein [Bifidobacterium avesanii]|uniref:DUF4391 family protein n=1 Tax=Bifidobacterium avesanii TaxID=1798157 RepID=A0A7K3TIP1_9BIFI|nr:DUF4391 domain-containing protein [Bifidobacterium avesanii]KAB8294625.1 tmp1 [Bifidobacterium avesanii]NEG78133.1 DUF4391 family protein [Bifidobacterium avesanii]
MSAATCGSVSVLTLGLPASAAVPAEKGALPKAAFVGRGPISAKLKARLVGDIASITLLGLLRPANTGAAEGRRVREILVLGLRLAGSAAAGGTGEPRVPVEVIEHIAAQRPGGILFVCVADGAADGGEADGKPAERCVLAVRRRLPGRAGHVERFAVYAGEWSDPADVLVEAAGATMDEVWDSVCSQVIFGTEDPADLDARLLRRDRIAVLEAEETRLVGDHKRAKDAVKRNEAFAKLAKVRAELAQLRG